MYSILFLFKGYKTMNSNEISATAAMRMSLHHLFYNVLLRMHAYYRRYSRQDL